MEILTSAWKEVWAAILSFATITVAIVTIVWTYQFLNGEVEFGFLALFWLISLVLGYGMYKNKIAQDWVIGWFPW